VASTWSDPIDPRTPEYSRISVRSQLKMAHNNAPRQHHWTATAHFSQAAFQPARGPTIDIGMSSEERETDRRGSAGLLLTARALRQTQASTGTSTGSMFNSLHEFIGAVHEIWTALDESPSASGPGLCLPVGGFPLAASLDQLRRRELNAWRLVRGVVLATKRGSYGPQRSSPRWEGRQR